MGNGTTRDKVSGKAENIKAIMYVREGVGLVNPYLLTVHK